VKVGILGGGLSGLTVASFLEADLEVLEKSSECGGLCRSLVEDGFTFDYGGAHIIYSKNQKMVELMRGVLGGNCSKGRRNNKIFYKGNFVKYPFENGLSDLPKEDNFNCLYYYLNNDYPRPRNFKEWIYYTFGKGIAEKYLIPYNRKIWDTEPEKMSLHWVEGRVPKPPLEDVLKSALGIPTEGYTHQLHFYYPQRGGIQALINSLEKSVRGGVTKNFEVKSIVAADGSWVVSDSEREKQFDQIVSTIPIFDLVNSLEDVPLQVQRALRNLKYNSLIAVLLGLEGNNLPPYTAVYFPDAELKFHRVGLPGVFSKRNVPPGKSSLLAEITTKESDATWQMDDEDLIDHVLWGLEKCGLIDPGMVCYRKVKRSKYAYVIYDQNYLSNIKIVKDYVEELGIILCGRFAEFEYLNMDACVQRGIALAQRLSGSVNRELTLSGPVKDGDRR
jgi:protoporphyrinogen oxidase